MSDWQRFKTEINLTQYAAFMGYEIIKKGTTRASIKMRRGDDIVIISRRDNKWIYFAVSGHDDNGTIVNFIQNRTGQTLAEIAHDLLAWLSALNDCDYQGNIKRHSPHIKGQDWNDVLKYKILFS